MQEIGLEFPPDLTPNVFRLYRSRESFDYVVRMCDETGSELCDLFRSNIDVLYAKTSRLLSWNVEDFSTLKGTEDERLEMAVRLRNDISGLVEDLLTKIGNSTAETHAARA